MTPLYYLHWPTPHIEADYSDYSDHESCMCGRWSIVRKNISRQHPTIVYHSHHHNWKVTHIRIHWLYSLENRLTACLPFFLIRLTRTHRRSICFIIFENWMPHGSACLCIYWWISISEWQSSRLLVIQSRTTASNASISIIMKWCLLMLHGCFIAARCCSHAKFD